jgi:predicted small secreted protein
LARLPRAFIILSKYLRFSVDIFKYKKEFEKMAKKVLLVVALVVLMFSLIGCQTVQGLGGDIKWTGEKGAELLE